MFVDQFNLRKNSWYVKLMNYIWGFEAKDFSHICPFFWLTLLNIIIFIPVFLVKTVLLNALGFIIAPLSDYIERVARKYEENLEKKADKIVENIESNDYYIRLYAFYKYNGFHYSKCNTKIDKEVLERIYLKLYTRFNIDREKNKVLLSKIDTEFNKILIESDIKEDKRKEVANKRKNRINKLVKTAKPIGQIILILITIIAVYFTVYGLYILIDHIKWNRINFKGIGKFLLALIGSIGMAFLVFWLLYWILEVKKYGCGIKKAFLFLCKPFIWLFKGIFLIFSILFQMIKNNCPAISWKE